MQQRSTQHLLAVLCLFFAMASPAPHARAAGTVGTGTPESCTSATLAAALLDGGTISFDCGPTAVTILISATLQVSATTTTIDGGGKITLSGGGERRILRHSSRSNSSILTIRNIGFANGYTAGDAFSGSPNGSAIHSVFQGAQPTFKPSLILENVTFRNNQSVWTGAVADGFDFGGTVYSQGGSVTISNSIFENNRADGGAGGAIHILQSGLSITSSTFRNNSAIGGGQGGAIYIDGLGGENGQFSVTLSTFTNNTSHNSGGAIYVNMYENSSGTVIDRSSFVQNAIVGGNGALGGAISGGGTNFGGPSGNPSISITNSTFMGNSVRSSTLSGDGSGGALAFAQRARITISNSTFSENRAEGTSTNANGGALYIVNNTNQFTINNSTFAHNYAGWVGGAISNSEINDSPGGIVRNTIFANNTADNGPNNWNIQQHCSSELADDGSNIQYPGRLTNGNFFNDVTCFEGKSAPNQMSLPDFVDPKLLALRETGGPTKTMPLAHDSPAINAGNAATCTSTDQRGIARNGICDKGAHEFGSTPVVIAVTPAFVGVGGAAFLLTVDGADFDPGSSILWEGSPRTTIFVDSTRLQATIAAEDIEELGQATIRVRNSAEALSETSQNVKIIDSVVQVCLPLVRR
jgi:predicted outer membrane repeat protein